MRPEGLRALLLKVYLLKGSPMASPRLVDSINVLTVLTNPGTFSVIHTLKEAQQKCWGGRGKQDRTCEATYGQP